VQDLREWTTALCAELGIELGGESDADVDALVAELLDVARVAAHRVARPAAPVTTFVVGLAAARGGPEAVARAAGVARRLAESWPADPGGPP
jgi:hypothetical protein